MHSQKETDFNRIAEAIDYIKNNFIKQPSLADVAKHVHLSPSHFQKMFTDWAGVSPKKFLQYISINHAKSILRNRGATLFDSAIETGLSGTSRLYDLFINIEGMTPGEYKNKGENLYIEYSYAESHFGKTIIASTPKGICHIAFCEDETLAYELLKSTFSNAQFKRVENLYHKQVLKLIGPDVDSVANLKLHIKGTEFQLKVWETLLTIPSGVLCTYGEIAKKVGNPNASRAVGTAIGHNPIAYLIPCHRVIQASGIFGGYMWGPKRKTAIIGWEAARFKNETI